MKAYIIQIRLHGCGWIPVHEMEYAEEEAIALWVSTAMLLDLRQEHPANKFRLVKRRDEEMVGSEDLTELPEVPEALKL